ncbi:MAG TPA: 3-hydroxybenzoate 4-monooxygenase, partial [Arthrobacter bacterium]|nr:3-hydroxybenzoate 4-monooxygenase [Arthrobacter sp.]
DRGTVRSTTIEQIIGHANAILHPYTLDVRNVAWHSVYEVAHRLTDRFDDVLPDQRGTRTPRVFITGDACHTHSAKAGQGMNVSLQDGFNL